MSPFSHNFSYTSCTLCFLNLPYSKVLKNNFLSALVMFVHPLSNKNLYFKIFSQRKFWILEGNILNPYSFWSFYIMCKCGHSCVIFSHLLVSWATGCCPELLLKEAEAVSSSVDNSNALSLLIFNCCRNCSITKIKKHSTCELDWY